MEAIVNDLVEQGQQNPEMSISELVELYLNDHELYNTTFFPETCRQASAPFHKDIDNLLWAGHRKTAIMVFRDGAKTTRIRLFLSKRIAYAFSRTVLYISKGESYATATIEWLQHQIINNTKWATFYGLQKGSVWTNEEIEIVNTIVGVRIRIIAAGIQGQVRGLNVLDYRPDLIVADDVIDEKTVNTEEQIQKVTNLLFGSVYRTLTAPADNPDAMFVMIQTPLHVADPIMEAMKDGTWASLAIGCFVTHEAIENNCVVRKYTLDANGHIQSSWPGRWPVNDLLKDKASYIDRGLLSLWLREMEVTLTSSENAPWKPEWLMHYDILPATFEELVLCVDPASSEKQTADWHVTGLVGKHNNNAMIIAQEKDRGLDIEGSCNRFMQFLTMAENLAQGKIDIKARVEITGYQRQFKRAIERKMQEKLKFISIVGVQDKRPKPVRIQQTIAPVAFARKLYCHKGHKDFIEQYQRFPAVPHDDHIDCGAIGIDGLNLHGAGGQVVGGNVERIAATQSLIVRSAERMIRPSVGRMFRHG